MHPLLWWVTYWLPVPVTFFCEIAFNFLGNWLWLLERWRWTCWCPTCAESYGWVTYWLPVTFYRENFFFHEIAFYSLGANVENVKKLLVETIKQMAKVDWTDVIKKNKVNMKKVLRYFQKTCQIIFLPFVVNFFLIFGSSDWLIHWINQSKAFLMGLPKPGFRVADHFKI